MSGRHRCKIGLSLATGVRGFFFRLNSINLHTVFSHKLLKLFFISISLRILSLNLHLRNQVPEVEGAGLVQPPPLVELLPITAVGAGTGGFGQVSLALGALPPHSEDLFLARVEGEVGGLV